jgi:hypothetical protein
VELYLHSPSTPLWRDAQLEKKAQAQLYLQQINTNFNVESKIQKLHFEN